MRSSLPVVFVMFVTASCATSMPPEAPIPTQTPTQSSVQRSMFCFVDGRTANCDEWLQRLTPADIERIEILKAFAAEDRFGPEAEGAILLSTKQSRAVAEPSAGSADHVFYFVDGRTASRADFERLAPAEIERIEILKSWAATARYGPEAEAGVIRITTKRGR